MENMYLLISILKSHKITPIFIFDGKPPPEKRDLLRQRRLDKKDAEVKYNDLKTKLEGMTITDEESKHILLDMENLKRQFVRVKDEQILKVKNLMDAYGVEYYDALGEADKLCAYLVKTNKAFGCMSDDMDMFLYGCSFVLRNLSLMNHTVILYNTKQILKDLDLSETMFRKIMVLSGTDYNINTNTSLKESINWFYEYSNYCDSLSNTVPDDFYIWIKNNTKYINDYEHLLHTYEIFEFNNEKEFENWDAISIKNKAVDEKLLRDIMEKEGFVFIHN